ncbi:28S ribosomal protein S23, mitochondrial, partial [Stegodyphus mimosarum]
MNLPDCWYIAYVTWHLINMAGNRLQRTGSIFARVTGLLKTGAMKEQDKPIWYDVYKIFP